PSRTGSGELAETARLPAFIPIHEVSPAMLQTTRRLLIAIALAIVLVPKVSFAQDNLAEYIRENYERRDYKIPMRDGVRLYTVVYAPKTSELYPILIRRTPYGVGPYDKTKFPGTLGPNKHFPREGHIFASQNVRACYMSDGKFDNMGPQLGKRTSNKDIDESTDTYDTIDWLIKHLPNHNGKVGLWGISYPGFYASAGMINAHPALKAVSPQA